MVFASVRSTNGVVEFAVMFVGGDSKSEFLSISVQEAAC